MSIIGSLSNNDSDGNDYVTKVKSYCFKLNRAYSISFYSSKVGNFFWSWILTRCSKVQEKKKNVKCLLFTSSPKREIRQFFTLWSCMWRHRNVQKSVLSIKTYRVFSLTWPASKQIYWYKRKRLHKKRVQLPQDWFGTPTWPPFYCFGTPIWPPWRHVKTLYCILPFSLTPPSWLLSSLMTVVTYSIFTYWVQWHFQGHRSFYSFGFVPQISCWVVIGHVSIHILFLFLWKTCLKNTS